ncbi:preprotein translocase subunit SecY [Merismopedia glauca]|uniref:Protein translocase subunit SecY n=1 Tax=Merismopedia glauca CCAP 1448/3 TaxID=1296344 RepID=A0A2T1BYT4_9CYAN|nr:preprotein translocase subunit SecY [Merismopedia glauca]PSB01162.1 preprotein translocase subunit SecY [Merismopedia glauca CCAP 1448/3]
MDISRDKAPTAQETFMQMAQAAGLRGRLLVTLGLLILVTLGTYIPIPNILITGQALADLKGNTLLQFASFFTRGVVFIGQGEQERAIVGLFALGILPYINASIIIQILTTALPALENLQKNEGEAGRRKISQITRYVTLGWAIIQSIGITFSLLQRYATADAGPWFIPITALVLTAGSMFVMWVSEVITERGVGNGASLLIFLSIVSTLPSSFGQVLEQAGSGDNEIVGKVILLLLVFLAMIVGIVFVQEGSRRIPIISARRQVGRRLYRERSNYLPLRLNQGGVMPIIFASAVLVLPYSLSQFAANFTRNDPDSFLAKASVVLGEASRYLSPGVGNPQPWVYVIFYVTTIIFFSYFYASLIINPVDLSQNLKKMGASIPGIRPGRTTSEYIERVMNRLTFLGAMFLGLVTLVPTAVESSLGITAFQGFGATSLLILVGVAIDTAKQIQTYVISQRYEGMVKQ